jgi:hypothetical protein
MDPRLSATRKNEIFRVFNIGKHVFLSAKTAVIGAKQGKLPPLRKAREAANLEFRANQAAVRSSLIACVLPVLNRMILPCLDPPKNAQEPQRDVPMQRLLTS